MNSVSRGPWLGLSVGVLVGCMFRSEFLLFAECEDAEHDCYPAWGEKRTPQDCFKPDEKRGYCTEQCQVAADCPDGEGMYATAGKSCIEVEYILEPPKAPEWRDTCVLTCAVDEDPSSCPDGMSCRPYQLRGGRLTELCFWD